MQELRELYTALILQETTTNECLGECNERLDRLKLIRNHEARIALAELVPNLTMHTIRRLRKAIPSFVVKTTKGWFGREKVDPHEDIDLVRVRLGIYLDNMPGAKQHVWDRVVGSTDTGITNCTELIKQLQGELVEISKRQAAIKKLLDGGMVKLPMETQEQIKQAANAVKTSPRAMSQPIQSSPVPQLQNYGTTSNSPDYLSVWLWYTLLTNNYDSSQADNQSMSPVLEHDQRDHGGANDHHHVTDQTTPDDTANPHDNSQAVSIDDMTTHHHSHHNHGTLDQHADLGSQSFS